MVHHGIIVYIRTQRSAEGERLIIQGRLENGESFGILMRKMQPRFFLPQQRIDELQKICSGKRIPHTHHTSSGLRSMTGMELGCFQFDNYQSMLSASSAAREENIPTYESDFPPARQFMLDADTGIELSFEGTPESGQRVAKRFIDPKILSGLGRTESRSFPLNILSTDIETNRDNRIRCISLAMGKSQNGALAQNRDNGADIVLSLQRQISGSPKLDYRLEFFANEFDLLSAFRQYVLDLDPDIITGWNVIGFDLRIILKRMVELGVPTDIGRSTSAAEFVSAQAGMPEHCEIPGRVALDSMRIMRMHPNHFESYSLEFVSASLLGRGKAEKFRDENKMDALDALWANEAERFLDYCMEDSRLVLEILQVSGLMELTVHRSLLCSTPLGRAWGSIYAFEQLYSRELHRLGYAAPDNHVDQLSMSESPGGTIIFPRSGVYPRVILLDFKGLYPSIIRSFGIDPLAHHRALAGNTSEFIEAPNGARFSRQEAILPRLLEGFYEKREDAKKRGDSVASFTYKILANSFYGVLGSPGCRVAVSDLASAITSFAREILYWSRDYVEKKGYRVIYGDTDSLFVLPVSDPAVGGDTDAVTLFDMAQTLSEDINSAVSRWVEETYGHPGFLEIEFEQLFIPLYIPPLKSVSSGVIAKTLEVAGMDAPQGRAKSYAGLTVTKNSVSDSLNRGKLIIKGMEAVRSDWSDFARNAQESVLDSLLRNEGEGACYRRIESCISRLKDGSAIEELIFSKRLSKPAGEYRGGIPPHVKAAIIAEKSGTAGPKLRKIRYLMAADGPQPVMTRSDLNNVEPDVQWYLEKQLIPVLRSINSLADFDLEAMVLKISPPDGQGELW